MSIPEQLAPLAELLKRISEGAPRSASFWEKFDHIDDLSVNDFAILSSAAPRRLGRKLPELNQADKDLISGIYGSLSDTSPGFLGRFLLAASVKNSESLKEMIIRGGDEEQAAAIMALNFRKDAKKFKDDVAHICRTNSTIVHSAVSQNNPYAAKYFDDQEFKQLTIKTIFMGLDFDQIHGLEDRFTGELGQSLTDFFDERRAAGRWLPDSVINFMKKKGLLS